MEKVILRLMKTGLLPSFFVKQTKNKEFLNINQVYY